jgi:NADH-quinone oxidoreductase subunit N
MFLIATAVAVLLVPFFVRRPNGAAGTVSLIGLAIALISLLVIHPTNEAVSGRFAGMLTADGVAFFWKVLLLIFTLGVTLLWFTAGREHTRQGDGPEFFLLLICATLGMALMASASNLLMVFLAIELASLPSYVLAGFRKTHRLGAEASLKYVLFGAAASSIMAWGFTLLYGVCGTLDLYSSTAADGHHIAGVAEQVFRQPQASAMLLIAWVAILVGIFFKISAVPFHLWCPDVFEGAPIDVTTFLSVASKGGALVLLLRIAMALGESAGFTATTINITLAGIIGVVGVLTCTVGNTAAYVQTNIKRLLAYSSIAHAGYMLCTIALMVRGGAGDAGFATVAPAVLLFYLAVYLFMNLGAFAVAAAVGRSTGSELLDAFSGLGRRSPLLAACMTLCCFSLIGVPPLAGFTAKFNLMAALGANGGWWWALVAAIAVNTLLSIYYYLRIVRVMYLEDRGAPAFRGATIGGGIGLISAAMLVAMFVGSNFLTRISSESAKLRTNAATDVRQIAAK